MGERRVDAVLLDARKELTDLRLALHDPNVDYHAALQKAAAKLKQDADTIYSESSVLPLQAPVAEEPEKLERVVEPPREDRPVKMNKATELRMKFVRPVREPPQEPPVVADSECSVRELIQRGVLSESDDAAGVLPGVDVHGKASASPLVPGVVIDVAGAAREAEARRAAKQMHGVDGEVSVREPEQAAEGRSARPWKGAPRVYEDLQDEYAHQTLLVVKGKIAKDTPDFESFRRTNSRGWHRVYAVLVKIEEFCDMFGIQFAEINGRKLSEAAQLPNLTYDDVHSCLVNVEEFVNKKLDESARIIQRNVRLFLDKVCIEQRKRKHRAAYRIQCWWRGILRSKGIPDRNVARNEEIIEKARVLAQEFAKDIDSRMDSLESSEKVAINVIVSGQDLVRTFSLMYTNVTVILIMTDLPAPYVWDDIVEFFAHCGIPNVNERIHFIPLRPMISGDGISHRMQCDMKAIARVKRLLKGRTAFIEPHADWFAERRLSVDVGLPIFGVVDTVPFQSRKAIKDIFTEASVETPLSTRECRSVADLCDAAHTLLLDHREITRFLVRYGFSQNDSSVAYFDVTPDLLKLSCDVPAELSRILSVSPKTTVSHFFKMVETVGGLVEAIPSTVNTFPSVALLLSGDKKMKVLGTFERTPHAPFRFAGAIVPATYANHRELLNQAKMVAGILMKRNVIGYVIIDFICHHEDSTTRLTGYDIRLNAYPSLLFSAYLTLCADFNEETGQMILLKNIGYPDVSPIRYAFVQTGVTHPGIGTMSIKKLRKALWDLGLFFDMLYRTGFRIQFLESPGKGRGFALLADFTIPKTMQLIEIAYTSLTRYFGQKAGSDTNSTLADALQAVRRYRERFLP